MVKPSVVSTPSSYRRAASALGALCVAWGVLLSAAPASAHVSDGDEPDETAGAGGAELNAQAGADGASRADADSAASTDSQSTEGVVGTSGSGGLFEGASSGELTLGTDSATPQRYELSGYVRGTAFMGKIPEYRQGYMQAAYGELSLQLRTKRTEYGDAFGEARMRYGMQGGDPKYEAELREGYVNAYLGPVDIRLGQQIIVWGKADGFNPTNNLTPTNLSIRSPHDDDRRVGNFASRVFLNMEPLRLEGVWVPMYRAVELPPFVYPKYVVEG